MEASSFEHAVYIYTNLSSLDLESRAPKSAIVRLQAILLGREGSVLQRASRAKCMAKRPRLAARRGKVDAGGRTGLRLPLYIGCNLYADSGAAA